ncbi:hypothetical protein J3F83DRAFT_761849 [Trichoderma novae-zelandiae]
MATSKETGYGHELSALAPIVVRCPSPFRNMGRTAPARRLPALPDNQVGGGSSAIPPATETLPAPAPVPVPVPASTPSPEPTPETLGTCYVCLAHKGPGALIRGGPTNPRFPLAGRCLDCVDKTPGFDVGERYELVGGGGALWVCRWCGGLVALGPAWDGVELHGECGGQHARALRGHLLDVGGAVLCVAASFASVFGFLRYRGWRVYHLPLFVEMNRLMLLVGMLYHVVRASFPQLNGSMDASPEDGSVDEASDDFQLSLNGAAPSILLILWLLMHALFSCLGHTIVFYEWKTWRRSRPGMSFWRRVAAEFIWKMVIWADPFSIEQGPPPRWWRGLWRRLRGFGGMLSDRGRGLPM